MTAAVEVDEDRLRDLFAQGCTIRQISQALGVSNSTVHRVAERNGLRFKRRTAEPCIARDYPVLPAAAFPECAAALPSPSAFHAQADREGLFDLHPRVQAFGDVVGFGRALLRRPACMDEARLGMALMREAGMPVADIADVYGTTATLVRTHLDTVDRKTKPWAKAIGMYAVGEQ
ncbi:MAG: helix-turn-helix domain-containing protein [Pigmentiphaga sp.]